jgi:putative membrane-bound dehydrogenase-like protein
VPEKKAGYGLSLRILIVEYSPQSYIIITMKTHTFLSSLFLACLVSTHVQAENPESGAPTHVPLEFFQVAEGLKVTLWAKSPLLHNPTNMDIDRFGRVWIAEGMNYRGRKVQDQGDKIVVVSDKDGDGQADHSHVFVQEPALVAPLGIAVMGNKVVVSQPPDLIVYTDVNDNAVFDQGIDTREVILTGWGGRNHDHSLHSVSFAPSGQWIFNTGNAGGHHVKGPDGTEYFIGSWYAGKEHAGKPSWDGHVYIGGAAFRMNPDGTGLRVIGHNFRNSYEQVMTSFGDVFQNDNDDPPASRTTWLMEHGNMGYASADGLRKWKSDQRPGQITQVAEWRQEDPGTNPAGDVYGKGAPTGIAFNESDGLGEKYRGLLLSAEPARNVILGYFPERDGAGYKLERFPFLTTNPEEKFAGVDTGAKPGELNTLFRPSDIAIGPDGAVYIADWFDSRVGGHGTRDKDGYGAIYRVAPPSFKSSIPEFDTTTVDGAIEALLSPANNVRSIGFTALRDKGDEARKPVEALLKDENPYVAARAVWLLAQLGPKGIKRVEDLLNSPSESLRLTAFRALDHIDHEVIKHAKELSKDESAAVRRECALAMRDRAYEQSREVLIHVAEQYDGKDRAYLEAIGTGAVNHEEELYQDLRKRFGSKPGEWSDVFAGLAWRLHPESSVPDIQAYIESEHSSAEQKLRMLTGLAFIRTRSAAEAMKALATDGPDSQKKMASWWVDNRAKNEWSSFSEEPEPVEIQNALVPTSLGAEVEAYSVEDVLKLKGDAVRGKAAVARCYVCHEIDGKGLDWGPNITGFAKANSLDVVVTALVDPSADLSHGFEGKEITTTDDKVLQGFIMVEGNPTVIKVFGGADVSIPFEQIKRMRRNKTSLMIPASKLGMTAQDVADVASYLKSL